VQTEKLAELAVGVQSSLAPSRGLILQIDDDGAGKRQKPLGLYARIGGGRDCQVVLADRSVSRVHAEVRAMRGGVMVTDCGSTNGTRFNGALIREAFVPVGASFVVGKSTIHIIDGGVPRLPPSPHDHFGGLVGTSVLMREVFAVLERVAPSEATVLLEGPSGTGKEAAARGLHEHSKRKGRFVSFDCTTTPRDLLPSALFGHKKGAFTGAAADRAGAFVEAHGGTLFLDELGELAAEGQAQLLRVLETRQVTAVGDDRPRAVDVRIVAATNRDLFERAEAGAFRVDLLHRLAVVHVQLPALLRRLDDLPILIRALYAARGLEPGPIDGDNLLRLQSHAWHGNIRELRNVLERSLVLASADERQFSQLQLWLQPAGLETPPDDAVAVDTALPYKDAKEALLEQFDSQYLPQLLQRFNDNLTHAAAHAGLSRRHLRALLVKAGLRDGDGRDDDSE
jgi:DNA-binding NtrC family response regulator